MVSEIHMQQRETVWERKRKEEKSILKEKQIEKSSNQLIASNWIWKKYLRKNWKIGAKKFWVTSHGHDDNKTKLSVRVKIPLSCMYFQAVSKFQIIF